MPSTPTAAQNPTQSTRTHATRIFVHSTASANASEDEGVERAKTPPRPSTPPNSSLSVTYNTSLMRTPVSNKTPTRSSVRGKPTSLKDDDDAKQDTIFRTPSRRPGAGFLTTGLTPRQFLSPAPWNMSPFRTPSRRIVLDPVDPTLMLDEELLALASERDRGLGSSPVGFFERGKGLLYESPSLPSPGGWHPW